MEVFFVHNFFCQHTWRIETQCAIFSGHANENLVQSSVNANLRWTGEHSCAPAGEIDVILHSRPLCHMRNTTFVSLVVYLNNWLPGLRHAIQLASTWTTLRLRSKSKFGKYWCFFFSASSRLIVVAPGWSKEINLIERVDSCDEFGIAHDLLLPA